MFKLRPRGQGPSGPSQPPTIETVRRRARQRLIGATVLVVAGIVGFSLLFDAQPRPVQVDVAIDIPSRTQAPPLALPVPAEAGESAPAEEARLAAPADAAEPAPAVVVQAVPAPPAPPPPAPAPAPAPSPSKSAVTPAAPPVPSAPPTSTPPTSAPAPAPAAAAASASTGARLVVQVGAYADARRAQEVRNRLERAGLRTYAQVAQTAEGPRTRVRLGPFDSRAEAERAAERVKALDLPAVILTL